TRPVMPNREASRIAPSSRTFTKSTIATSKMPTTVRKSGIAIQTNSIADAPSSRFQRGENNTRIFPLSLMTLYLSLKAVAYAGHLMEKEASPMITRHNFSCRAAALGGVAVAALLLSACANDVVQSNVTSPPAATSEGGNYASLLRVADAMRASGDNV